MLATRRQAHRERLPRVLHDARARSTQQFQAERDRYAAELERIAAEGDAAALADPRRQTLLERLARVRAAIAGLSAEKAAVAQEKYRRLHGLLSWDLTMDFKPRLAEAQRSLQELDVELATYGQRRAALERAERDLPLEFDGFQARIGGLRQRITVLRSALAGVSVEQDRYLSELAVSELRRLQERIVTYLTQARFAVAQIYDEAAAKQEATP
jgi:hypothetical protein